MINNHLPFGDAEPGPLSEKMKQQALKMFEETIRTRLSDALGEIKVDIGDSLRFTYTLYVGTPEERAARECGKEKCGLVHQGLKCHLLLGHDGPHCGVVKWND